MSAPERRPINGSEVAGCMIAVPVILTIFVVAVAVMTLVAYGFVGLLRWIGVLS